MNIQALIFDFDGLILDTEGPIFQSFQEMFDQHGASLPLEIWAQLIGTTEVTYNPFDDLEQQTGRKLDRTALDADRVLRELQLVAAQPVLPGVLDYLESAKRLGLRVGCASSSLGEWVWGHLRRLDLLHYFECIRTASDVQRTKPEPELYLTVLHEFGLRGEQAIALEDSPNGISAAKRAGLFTVAVPNPLTRQLTISHADLCLHSLEEMGLERVLQVAENGTMPSLRGEPKM